MKYQNFYEKSYSLFVVMPKTENRILTISEVLIKLRNTLVDLLVNSLFTAHVHLYYSIVGGSRFPKVTFNVSFWLFLIIVKLITIPGVVFLSR